MYTAAVVADVQGGRLTSAVGLLLSREVDRRWGLIDAISLCLPHPRDPRFVIHEQPQMPAHLYVTIIAVLLM